VATPSVTLPLEYLREVGAVPLPVSTVDGPVERLLAEFGRYLLDERGLTERTVGHYVPAARLFLASGAGGDLGGLERLSAADVSMFLSAECPKLGVSAARTLTCGLRAFLRWLYLTGRIADPLVWAVPAVADLRDRSLPRGVDAATVKRLLASCDRRRMVGRRDYAVLLLLSRLGLRAGEVAAITLDDIDWHAGELLVRNRKGRRLERLPLPVDVGEAIVAYLRRRPRIESRALFLRVIAPVGGIDRFVVAGIVCAACRRAGLPRVGAHRLRYTAATEMLRAGATLQEIGEVLRHKDPSTTMRYAKVDRKTLRRLAQPWPQGGAA
jgi:integrase